MVNFCTAKPIHKMKCIIYPTKNSIKLKNHPTKPTPQSPNNISPLSPQCNEKTFSNWLVSDILRLLVITIRTYKPSEARIEQF